MPTSPRAFQDSYRKDSKTQDIFRKRKNMVLSKDIEAERRENYILWNTFFRRNIHRFIEQVLGIKLFPYQIIWIYLMSISDVFISICSRAAAKSFIAALFCLAKGILYPGSEIIISASTLKQSSLILTNKITTLRDMSPVLQREIASIVSSQNDNRCILQNGSVIKVVASNEGARGNRATMLLMDEFILLDKEVVDSVLTPFLYVRQAPFMLKQEYQDYPQEEPQTISISSAGFKSHWSWRYIVNTIKGMVNGKRFGFFATDYLVSIKSGIKTQAQIDAERRNSDPETFSREYENLYSGESGKSYFKVSLFDRKIKRAFYPLRQDLVGGKKNPYALQKAQDEIRVISYDVAARQNKANDNSVLSCIRLIPTHKGYKRSVPYMESSHGANVVSQALRLKEVFYDFQADYIVLDIQQNGIGIYDTMSSITTNEERGIEYPAFGVMEHNSISEEVRNELRDRCLGVNPLPVVYPISASAKLNSEIAVAFRSALQKKLFDFLVSDIDADDYLTRTNKEFLEVETSLRPWFLHPHVQTNLLIQECVNLELNVLNGMIKLTEGTGRKDRYTCVSYANYFVSEVLDRELLKQGDNTDEWSVIQSISLVY